jgi:hypothetical protein
MRAMLFGALAVTTMVTALGCAADADDGNAPPVDAAPTKAEAGRTDDARSEGDAPFTDAGLVDASAGETVCPSARPAEGAACSGGGACRYDYRCCCEDYVPNTECRCVRGAFVCGPSGACDPPPACADASPLCPPPGLDAGVAGPAPVTPAALDEAVWRRFPEEMEALAGAGIPDDETGLLGRNRTWGAMYAPRFQMGAGGALRTALVAGRPREAALAFSAIRAGLTEVADDGYLPQRLPEAEFPGVVLSPADIASGGAFFLGDACLGLLALEARGDADDIMDAVSRQQVRERAVRAARWLLTQADLLVAADAEAPNRLLFDALAFQACGVLGTLPELVTRGETFARAAVARLDPAGFFVEGGGHDTSYQGVAVLLGVQYGLAGSPDTDGARGAALHRGARWLADRIDEAGRLDSSGNTRTCEGGESFLGEPKLVALPTVFAALAYVGVSAGDETLIAAAGRLAGWVRAHPDGDPCQPE